MQQMKKERWFLYYFCVIHKTHFSCIYLSAICHLFIYMTTVLSNVVKPSRALRQKKCVFGCGRTLTKNDRYFGIRPLQSYWWSKLSPISTQMINFSLTSGSVQAIWKSALVVPFLKKTGLELTFNNFRPVSNLSLISKLGEKVVVSQILGHCREHAPLSSH